MRSEPSLDLRGAFASKHGTDGLLEVALAHERHHHVRAAAIIGHRQIEVMDVRANVGHDGCNFTATVRHSAIDDVHARGSGEFSYPLGARADLHFRAEGNLEEALGYLGVGERRSLGAPSHADFGVLRPRLPDKLCGQDDRGDEDRESPQRRG